MFFNLFSMFDTEQMYFILFVKDLYYYPFFFIIQKITRVYTMGIKCHLHTVSHSIYIYRSV